MTLSSEFEPEHDRISHSITVRYDMTANVSIKTEVPREDIVLITILERNVPVWTGTLTNFAPVQATLFKIVTTTIMLEVGFKFTLQPFEERKMVIAEGVVTTTGSPPDTFAGVVAYWTWPRDPSPPPDPE